MQVQTKKTSLDTGIRIGRYEIRDILGVGGFGITYKGWDIQLNRMVAIKEYLPIETAVRAHDASTVQAHESRIDEYQYGLQRFLDEAKTLAKFHHQNIIDVHDYLLANNTAYLIMSYEQGQTFSEQLKKQGVPPPELELIATFKAILHGLQHIHKYDYYHRDIKPGNIYIRNEGEPVLIDFGAARQAIGARSRSLTSIVSAGYAPSEQYGSNQSKQGPWSDLYAVGATMYRSISGQEPVDAPTRSSAIVEDEPDPLTSATKIGQGRYTERLLKLIDWMLAPAIKNRPQNVSQVLRRLEQNSGTEDSKTNQEARSTLATVIVSESDHQRPIEIISKQGAGYQPEVHSDNNRNEIKPWLIIGSISIMILAVIVISQKQPLQQLDAGVALTQVEIPDESEPSQYNLQNQLKGELEETEQQVIQVQKEEQVKPVKHVKEEPFSRQQAKTQQIIKTLLTAATIDIEQFRLSTPRGNNAVEKYHQILQLDPNNQEAQHGFTIIVEKYLQLARIAREKQHYDRAARLINKAKYIQADNPKVFQATIRLKIAQEKVLLKTDQEKTHLKTVKEKQQRSPLDEISDFFKKIMFIK